ncbi:MAG: hypothetical protein H6739_41430 [Alphaproteobacteria bacterium]|nr:hypothetical protein [Alphaproteobacteria bacterium]
MRLPTLIDLRFLHGSYTDGSIPLRRLDPDTPSPTTAVRTDADQLPEVHAAYALSVLGPHIRVLARFERTHLDRRVRLRAVVEPVDSTWKPGGAMGRPTSGYDQIPPVGVGVGVLAEDATETWLEFSTSRLIGRGVFRAAMQVSVFALTDDKQESWTRLGRCTLWLYALLSLPQAPWTTAVDLRDDRGRRVNPTLPGAVVPVEALEMACVWARGATDAAQVAEAVTRAIALSGEARGAPPRLRYNPNHTFLSVGGETDDSSGAFAFDLLLATLRGSGLSTACVDCRDCASAVVWFSNALGAPLQVVSVERPVSDNKRFQVRGYRAIGWDGPYMEDGKELLSFAFHELAWLPRHGSDGLVFDACFGPDIQAFRASASDPTPWAGFPAGVRPADWMRSFIRVAWLHEVVWSEHSMSWEQHVALRPDEIHPANCDGWCYATFSPGVLREVSERGGPLHDRHRGTAILDLGPRSQFVLHWAILGDERRAIEDMRALSLSNSPSVGGPTRAGARRHVDGHVGLLRHGNLVLRIVGTDASQDSGSALDWLTDHLHTSPEASASRPDVPASEIGPTEDEAGLKVTTVPLDRALRTRGLEPRVSRDVLWRRFFVSQEVRLRRLGIASMPGVRGVPTRASGAPPLCYDVCHADRRGPKSLSETAPPEVLRVTVTF